MMTTCRNPVTKSPPPLAERQDRGQTDGNNRFLLLSQKIY
jgi:hypothetical protein